MQTPPLPQDDSGRPVPPEAEKVLPDSAAAANSPTIPPVSADIDGGATVDLFVHPDADADDAPTVISKGQPRLSSAEDGPGSLRGRQLAHFELIEPIGVGGMAAVIRARDTQLDRSVALKILPPEMASDAENVRRFHQEARSAAKLDHENIARVFFCGEDQKLHFIAFEFVEGENLRTVLERRGRLPVREALHYMLQVASGLMHAAERGVVHRDIKPSNIIISSNGRAKLVDMGLARMEGPHAEQALTQSGVTLGTFDYISPEQALEPREADVRSDIYSLGCTFYHVLTGQPPVPEGTAAKKLHHHQHVPPVDPRQLNPDIPDEVAAILGRMMAKDPKARYQRAEHLVQHLLLAAHKLGTLPAETPDGVLFVDAPLPSPPRTRPLLVAGLGAVILVTLIIVFGHGRAPWSGGAQDNGWANIFPPPKSHEKKSEEGGAGGPARDGPKPKDSGQDAKPTETPIRYEARSAEDLREFLRKTNTNGREVELVISKDIELPIMLGTGDERVVPNLVVRGKKVSIRAKEKTRPTIRFTYDAEKLAPLQGMDAAWWQGLIVESDDVTVKGLDFVVDGGQDEAERMAGLLLKGNREKGTSGRVQFHVESCQFFLVSQQTDLVKNRPSAVVVDVDHDNGDMPKLVLEDCYFVSAEKAGKTLMGLDRSGQDAVTLKTPAKVEATNCAFAPHSALFRIEGAGQSELVVRHCAALLRGESAVFHLAGDGAACKLDVRHSVWSGQNRPLPFVKPVEWRGAVLIRQEGSMAGAVKYQGSNNCYDGLDAFWVRPASQEKVVAAALTKFKSVIADTGSDDSHNLPPAVSPWTEADPLKALEERDPRKAFMVNDRVKDLRSNDEPDRWLVGLQRCAWGSTVGKLPDLSDKPALARNQRIVDPEATELPAGVYRKLSEALAAAKAGDVILLRFNGTQPIDPVRLDNKDHRNLTIRAHPEYHPVLTLGQTSERNAFLFRVHDGELTLEDLGFRLRPSKSQFTSQTVAELVSTGGCTFRRCVITLDRDDKPATLAAATIANPGALMKMGQEDAPSTPRLRFENCLVRGQGDLVAARAGRPFDLDARNSLAALDGSFLNINGQRDEDAPADSKTTVAVTLHHVTTYLTNHLVSLRAVKDFKGTGPIRVEASDCLFMSQGGKSLVHLDGPDPGDQKMRELLVWEGNHNAYWNFSQYLDRQDVDSTMAFGKMEWQKFTGEEGKIASMLSGERPVEEKLPMRRVTAAAFKVTSDVQGFGAALNLVPAPAGETKPPRSPRDGD
jgi:serine/threonine protein kinase